MGLAAVGLAVAGFVCITATTESWASAIQTQLQSLGPTAFLVPRSTSIKAFHLADFGMPQMPEYYLAKLRRSELIKKGQVAPRSLFYIQSRPGECWLSYVKNKTFLRLLGVRRVK